LSRLPQFHVDSEEEENAVKLEIIVVERRICTRNIVLNGASKWPACNSSFNDAVTLLLDQLQMMSCENQSQDIPENNPRQLNL
jgi:hypothetical protein